MGSRVWGGETWTLGAVVDEESDKIPDLGILTGPRSENVDFYYLAANQVTQGRREKKACDPPHTTNTKSHN